MYRCEFYVLFLQWRRNNLERDPKEYFECYLLSLQKRILFEELDKILKICKIR